MIAWLVSTAFAGDAVVSAAGGWDYQTSQPYVGGDLAFFATNQWGPALFGRATAAYAVSERLPMAITELGVMFVIPNDSATVRVGGEIRPIFMAATYRMPFELGEPSVDKPVAGVLPAALGLVEFEWKPEAPLVLGLKGGMGSTASDISCASGAEDSSQCIAWYPGAVAGFYLRKTWRSGLTLEATVGTSSGVTAGWTL